MQLTTFKIVKTGAKNVINIKAKNSIKFNIINSIYSP